MNPRFLEGFNRRCLSMGESRLRAALGEYPTSAAAGLNQQELDGAPAESIANRGDLFAFARFAKLRKSNGLNQPLTGPNRRRNNGQTRDVSIADADSHRHRVHHAIGLCLEHTLVLDAKGLQCALRFSARNLSAYLHPAWEKDSIGL